MTFDEQLRRAFDTLGDRLRDEMSRRVQGIADELAAAARERERAAADAHAQSLEEARRLAIEEGRTAALQDHERALREARERALDEGRAQALEEARQRAAEEAEARAAKDARDAEVRAARDRDAAAADGRAETLLLERVADGVRALDRARSLGDVLDTLASCAGRDAARVAVIVVRADNLQAWRLIGFGGLDAGGSLDATSADRALIADACAAGALRSDGARAVFPLPIGGAVVAALYAEAQDQAPLRTDALDVLARHAARVLESMTAFKAARAIAGDSGARAAEQAHGASETDDDAEDSAAARRYARLLVSEIKLYHEADVVAGRRDRDLMSRLGGEIARARGLYEQRVAADVRRRTDYFHDELVKTLADGDATLLQLT